MLNMFRKIIPERSSVRLFYHKVSAVLAAVFYRFPATRLKIIAVTGTSGKSTTTELIHYLIQSSGRKCGSISTVNYHFEEKVVPNPTFRTTLRCWTMQKLLRKMVSLGIEYCVIEVSSHAIDQNRIWGIDVDIAVVTNVSNNEHLDYHKTYDDYVKTKTKLFRRLNLTLRKSGVPKVSIVNIDDPNYEIFQNIPADRKWAFSTKKPADIRAENIRLSNQKTEFTLHVPNFSSEISVPLLGRYNVENILAATAVAISFGVEVVSVKQSLDSFPGVPGRLELVNTGQKFPVIVDFSYKPSALEAVLKFLKETTEGKIIVVFGGAYGRAKENLTECGKILDKMADSIVLTTDDPNNDDPIRLASDIRNSINRSETEGFFEIEDRYEAIRYAIYTAEDGDVVLVAGRGHEQTQNIGNLSIPFDDRLVCREILEGMKN